MVNHRALIEHHRTIVAGIRFEALRLSNGSGVFIHQRADGKIVNGPGGGILAGDGLEIERFRITRQAIAQPDVGGRRGHYFISPPLRGHQAGDGAVAGLGIPGMLADEQQAGRGKIAHCSVRELRQNHVGVGERAEEV